VSTRFLVLYWFARADDDSDSWRLGLAVPKKTAGAVARNRLKRQLKEIWRQLPAVPAGYDYVLVARPGLVEASEARGHEWLQERVAEALGKAAL
jgi:ribonuclease P protein component